MPGLAEDLSQLVGVGAEEHGIEILPVHVGVGARRGRVVGRRIAGRVLRLEVDDEADFPSPFRPARLHGGTMRAQQVVARHGRLERAPVSRGQRAVQVAAVGDHPGFVQRHPARHTIAKPADHERGVFGKPVCDVRIEPAAELIERRGEIPVVEGDHGLDAVREQRVDQPLVEVEARRVHAAAAVGQDPAPRDAEAIGREPERAHQRDVLRVPAVVVARDIAGVTVVDTPGRMREAVPDARAGAVGERRAFDLVRRRRRAPQEPRRKDPGSGCAHEPPPAAPSVTCSRCSWPSFASGTRTPSGPGASRPPSRTASTTHSARPPDVRTLMW